MIYEESDRIAPRLDRQMVEEELSQTMRSARSFHASGLGECARQQIYDILGFPKDLTSAVAKWIRSREVGDLIHGYYAERFRKAGLLIRNEWSLVEELGGENAYGIGGRLDDLLFLDERRVLVDIKTVDQKKFNQVPKGPKFAENYDQVQIYLHFLGLDEGILLYVNRSDNETKEFTVYKDEECIQRLLARAERLQWLRRNRVIPRSEPSWKCRFCPFLELCTLDGPDEYALPPKESVALEST